MWWRLRVPFANSLLTFFEESHNGFCQAFYHKKRSGGGGVRDGSGGKRAKRSASPTEEL